jgi:predicted N-acetyltransferase YhbS
MDGKIEILTAESERGRVAIEEVMRHSYAADISEAPAHWAQVRVVNGVPVSFILVDPDRHMEFPGGDVRYAFICDVATRQDRRMEGHFRAIMEHTFASLREAGIPLVLTHGRYPLYRRFGFEVFTHHCGVFTTPDQIERKLGAQVSEKRQRFLAIEASEYLCEDLLLVNEVGA